MKFLSFTLALLSLASTSYNQAAFMARLPVNGAVSEIGVSPAGKIWMASKGGSTYYTDGIDRPWHYGPLGIRDEEYSFSFETFERVNVLTEDILLISGYIQSDASEADFVYRSEDGGRSWKKIRFGEESWIDAACVTPGGKVWMSGSSQLIYYSADFGKSWSSFDKVEETGDLRFCAIHFAPDARTGLFGSTWNVLYKTTDNCKTWEKLPTPLSQEKYFRVSDTDDPEIDKVRIAGNRYFIRQDGRVFSTPAKKIDWTVLPGVADFELTENGELYLIHTDRSVNLVTPDLRSVWKSTLPVTPPFRAVSVRNNALYVLTSDDICRIDPSGIQSAELLTNDIPIKKPYQTVRYGLEEVGVSGSEILRFDPGSGRWYRFMTAPFQVAGIALFDQQILISDYAHDKLLVLDLDKKSLSPFTIPFPLFEPGKYRIRSLTIEKGSQGCFNSEFQSRIYQRSGTGFVAAKSGKGVLDTLPDNMEEADLLNLLALVDSSRLRPARVSDLRITAQDVAAYKAIMDREERRMKNEGEQVLDFLDYYSVPGKRTDFNYYRSMADSLTTVPDTIVDRVLQTGYGNWSTTTDWLKFSFEFEDGSKLTINNKDDKPGYLYLPWVVNFNGAVFKCGSVAVGRQINALTKGRLLNETVQENSYAIFSILDYLYRKSISKH